MLVYDPELDQTVCNHEGAFVEPACCSTAGSSGYVECGCGGQNSIVCPAPNCTGIEDYELEKLLCLIS